MHYDVLEARYVRDYVVWLRFRDGAEGEVDLQPALRGPVFDSLKELAAFKTFTLSDDFKTLSWPNGADLAPEYLYGRVTGRA